MESNTPLILRFENGCKPLGGQQTYPATWFWMFGFGPAQQIYLYNFVINKMTDRPL